ncbi:MAG TPA: hypothetical protein VIX73_11165, partial [Kofleriaceae bacterium]
AGAEGVAGEDGAAAVAEVGAGAAAGVDVGAVDFAGDAQLAAATSMSKKRMSRPYACRVRRAPILWQPFPT